MSSGQSLRNGNSVEPGLPKTFLMPKERNRPKVASLTVTDLAVVLAGLRDDIRRLPGTVRHSGFDASHRPGMTSTPYHVAWPFMVGWPAEFAVHSSMPPSFSLALTENSL